MTRYQFLLAQKESGELNQWYQYGVSTHIPKWMEIYAYHLEHPKDSYAEISYHFNGVTKSTAYRAIEFLSKIHQ